jgi:hypothetical protein
MEGEREVDSGNGEALGDFFLQRRWNAKSDDYDKAIERSFICLRKEVL